MLYGNQYVSNCEYHRMIKLGISGVHNQRVLFFSVCMVESELNQMDDLLHDTMRGFISVNYLFTRY